MESEYPYWQEVCEFEWEENIMGNWAYHGDKIILDYSIGHSPQTFTIRLIKIYTKEVGKWVFKKTTQEFHQEYEHWGWVVKGWYDEVDGKFIPNEYMTNKLIERGVINGKNT